MGMFDELKCRYPLPLPGANDLDYQTKDTESQWLDHYEIREDGTLWHEDYDYEDQSELTKWKVRHPRQEPPDELRGMAGSEGRTTRVNKRWEQVKPTGEILFYTSFGPDGTGWIEWSARFTDGRLIQLNLIEYRAPDATDSSSAERTHE